MTITCQPRIKTYDCAPDVTDFAVPFRFIEASDLLVQHIGLDGTLTPLTPTTHYDVDGVGLDGGGKVILHTPYAAGKIRIWLKLAGVQPNTYADNNPFPARSHEDALDRLTLLNAMRAEDFRRSFRVALGDCGAELPARDQRGGKLFAFNSDGDPICVSQVGGDEVLALDSAHLFWDFNHSAEPRLVIDPAGDGSGDLSLIPGTRSKDQAVVMLQSRVPHVDQGGARVWVSVNYADWDGSDLTKPTSKRSRFAVGVQARSQLAAPEWTTRPIPKAGDKDKAEFDALVETKVQAVMASDNLDHDHAYPIGYAQALVAWQVGWETRVFPQEVGAMALTAIADITKSNCKVEGLVVGAREEPPADPNADVYPSKGVAIQAITVRATKGPDPDDRRVWTEADGDNENGDAPGDEEGTGDDIDGIGDPGTANGAFTLRLNGGTTNKPASYYRSWAAVLAGGRAGYLNGFCLGKKHHFGDGPDDPDEDGDGVAGWGGVWGGRSFWHQKAYAVYAKDSCPGWVTIGHDGIDPTTPDDELVVGRARAPVDIVNTDDTLLDADRTVVAFNGQKLICKRQAAIGSGLTDSQKIAALIARLVAHGLIEA